MTKTAFKILSAILTAVIICCSFSGCSSTVKDAELRCPMANEPTSVDPQTASTAESMTIAANCYESLMKTDHEGKIVPAAASQFVVSSDGLVYTFKLKQNSKWHINSNHEEVFGEGYETAIDLRVTAHDFVFGIQRALDPATKAPQAHRLMMIKNAQEVIEGKLPVNQLGVIAIDDYTLQIQLEYASAELLQILSEPVTAPCNRAFFEATKGRYGLSAEYVLCNGPFYLSRWYSGNNIVLRRNIDNEDSQALAYSLTYAFTQDEDIILKNLLDKTYAAAPLTAAQISEAEKEGCTVYEVQNTMWGFVFNCSDETMSNIKLRLALVSTMNLNEIRSAANNPANATGIIPPSCTVDGHPYSELAPALGTLERDTEKAKKYFDEATAGKECMFTILCTPEYENAVRKIIQDWQQLFGITVSAKVESVEADELKTRVKKGNYQCAIAPITTDAQTAVEFLSSFKGGSNVTRFSSQSFDKLLSQLLTASTPESVVQGCSTAEKYLIQNAVICPLFFESRYIATNPDITTVTVLHSGNVIMMSSTEVLK